MLFKSLLAMASLASMTVALPAPMSRRQNVLYTSGGNQLGTYYYEDATNGDACAADGSQGAGWSNNQIKGVTTCESHLDGNTARNLAQLDTNRVVAISNILLNNGINGDGANLCGKQVNVFLDGAKVNFSEGEFFIWDGCERCNTQSGLDFSGQAYAEMFGDCRSGLSVNTGKKMTFEIVDVQIMKRDTNGEWTDGQETRATYGGSSPPPPPPPTTSTTPNPAPTSAPHKCNFDGNCLGATCNTDDDCEDPYGCVNGKCGLDN